MRRGASGAQLEGTSAGAGASTSVVSFAEELSVESQLRPAAVQGGATQTKGYGTTNWHWQGFDSDALHRGGLTA